MALGFSCRCNSGASEGRHTHGRGYVHTHTRTHLCNVPPAANTVCFSQLIDAGQTLTHTRSSAEGSRLAEVYPAEVQHHHCDHYYYSRHTPTAGESPSSGEVKSNEEPPAGGAAVGHAARCHLKSPRGQFDLRLG